MLPDEAVLAVEAIKLLDGDLRKACDSVWVVVAPRDLMLDRLAARGMPRREAELRLANQLSEEQFRAAADVVIVNDGDREKLRERVREAWAALGARGSRSSRGPGT
jgi:dephospho-CoA kinase